MKRIVIISLALLAVSCWDDVGMLSEDFRDNELPGIIEGLDERISSLEAQCERMNGDIEALQEALQALSENDHVKSVTSSADQWGRPCYQLSFLSGRTISLGYGIDGIDGNDGKDGRAPLITVQRGSDGIWYWLLDGAPVYGSDGNRLRASGEDGVDGITPHIKVEDGSWLVSWDNELTWDYFGPATGKDGWAIYSDARVEGKMFILTLMDGSELFFQMSTSTEINFSVEDPVEIMPGKIVHIGYKIVSDADEVSLTASTDGAYVAELKPVDKFSGTLSVTCPPVYSDGFVNMTVSDSFGKHYVKTISFCKGELIFHDSQDHVFPTEGGIVEIPLSVNFDYKLKSNARWLEVIPSTKGEMRDSVIVLKAIENQSFEYRNAELQIFGLHNEYEPVKVICIGQLPAYFNMDKRKFAFGHEGGSIDVDVHSSRPVSVPQTGVNWLNASVEHIEGDHYVLHLNALSNAGSTRRRVAFPLSVQDDVCSINVEMVQLCENYKDKNDLVFQVRANKVNDFTSTLPLSGEVDCYVDWGDGEVEYYSTGDGGVSHTYANTEAASYEVRVNGMVTELNSLGILPSITDVLQWGHTGLINMAFAFDGNTVLKSLCGDVDGAFSQVSTFAYAFKDCLSLETVPANLLAHASYCVSFFNMFENSGLVEVPAGFMDGCVSAWYCHEMFMNCKNLEKLPAGLFAKCKILRKLSAVFRECSSLVVLPAGLFAGCSTVVDMDSVFTNCTMLSELPDGLFAGCESVNDFSYLFADCWNLKYIPNNLFAGCTEAHVFRHVFINTGLVEIPDGLFDDCTKVISFEGTFYGTHIEEVPADLFAKCPDVQTFECTFCSCSSLQSVPVSLFDNCRKVIHFGGTFAYCSSLDGESPYTVIDWKKVHLYERNDSPYFNRVHNTNGCFTECWNLSDYASIPDGWKN